MTQKHMRADGMVTCVSVENIEKASFIAPGTNTYELWTVGHGGSRTWKEGGKGMCREQ